MSTRFQLAVALVLMGFSAAVADEIPPPRLVTADELLAGPVTLDLPKDRTYTVKVWGHAFSPWTLEVKDGFATLAPGRPIKTAQTGWATAGTITPKESNAVRLRVKPPLIAVVPAVETAKAKAKRAITPVKLPSTPAYVTISADPKFEATEALEIIRSTPGPATSQDRRTSEIRTNQQGADFHAPATAQAWRERAREVREGLLVSMGLWPMPPKTDLHPRVFDKIERDGYTIEKVVIETFPGFTLSGNLYRPMGKTGRLPLILCPHGHWEDGRVNPEVQPRCVHWAKLGCVVFLYDMVGYNDSKAFGHEFLNDRLRRWGLSLVTLQTWNSIRALDFLLTLPDVDAARVACTGESGGGTQTFLLTAVDDRIKYSAPVVMVSDSFQGGCVCENAAGLRIGTDNVEIAALTAPRPMKLVGATGDWTAKTMSNAYPSLRQVYALVGSTDDLSADVFDFPHNYNRTTRNAVYAFLAPRLLQVIPTATKEGNVKIEEPKTLWTHGPEASRPDQKTPEQLEIELIAMQSRQIDRLAPGTASSPWEATRGLLRRALAGRVGLNSPTALEIEDRPLRRSTRDGLSISHEVLSRKGTGEQIAVVVLEPSKANGRATVVFSSQGKARLVQASGKPRAIVAALLARGETVVGFDSLLTGESLDPGAPQARRPNALHYECYNPALPADRMQDLATVIAWTRSRPGLNQVSLIASGEAGTLALLARPLLDGVARTAIDLDGFDYGDGSSVLPAGLDLPGVLQFGGLKAAAALASPVPLWLTRPGASFNRKWPEKSYALDDAKAMLRIEDAQPKAEELATWIDTGEWPQRPAGEIVEK